MKTLSNPNTLLTATTDMPPLSSQKEQASFNDYINSLDEKEKVRLLGLLAKQDKLLNAFKQSILTTHTSNESPLTNQDLQVAWAKFLKEQNKNLSISPEHKAISDQFVDYSLALIEIELYKNYEISEIQSARQSWESDLQEARLSNDAFRIQKLQEIGKNIFYAENEEDHVSKLNHRYSQLSQLKETINKNPEEALRLLEEDKDSLLPKTGKELFIREAKRSRNQRQSTFAHTLLQNELQGLRLHDDSLSHAESMGYISPHFSKAYKEKFSKDNPYLHDDTLKVPMINNTLSLIDTYNPIEDANGSRKRSIMSLIALNDLSKKDKKELLQRLNEVESDAPIRKLYARAHRYLEKKYASDKDKPISKSTWFNTHQKKWQCKKVLTKYLKDHSDTLPSITDWEQLIPSLIYQATRSPFTIQFARSPQGFEYPMFINSMSEKKEEPSAKPGTWDASVSEYFSTHQPTSLTQIEKDLTSLFNEWLDKRQNPLSLQDEAQMELPLDSEPTDTKKNLG